MGVAGLGVPAAVAERIELLDIAEPQSRLFFYPGAQADLEGAVRQRVQRAERKSGALVAVAGGGGEDQGLVAFDRDDGGGQADLDRRQKLFAYPVAYGHQSRSMWNGRPSTIMLPGPISSSARSMRPSRPSPLSASTTLRRVR